MNEGLEMARSEQLVTVYISIQPLIAYRQSDLYCHPSRWPGSLNGERLVE
jgi:hypothetical protein